MQEQRNPVIPPASQANPQTGTLTIALNQLYNNGVTTQVNYRVLLWGAKQPIQFNSFKKSIQFDIHAPIQKLTQYFHDANVLNIECISKQQNNKKIASIILPMRRFIVDNTINDFTQNVPIFSDSVGSNRKKIGQIELMFKIQTFERPFTVKKIETSKNIVQRRDFNQNEIQEKKNKNSQNNNYQKQQGPISRLINKSQKFFNEEDPQLKQFQEIIRNNKKNFTQKQFENPLIEQRNARNMAAQRDYPTIEQIQRRFPNNKPCLQMTQLRMDELELLTTQNVEKNLLNLESGSDIQLYLEKMKVLVSKSKQTYLNVRYSYDSDSSEKEATTSINLKESSSNTYPLNFVLLLKNSIKGTFILKFQTNQGYQEIHLKQLVQKNSIMLKKKGSNKRYAEINYKIVQSVKNKSVQQNSQSKIPKKQQNQNNFVIVRSNLKNVHFRLKNAKFGVIQGKVVVFSQNKNNATEQQRAKQQKVLIQMEKQNKIIGWAQCTVNSIFKQQNLSVYSFEDRRQVCKINVISGRGTAQQALKIVQLQKVQSQSEKVIHDIPKRHQNRAQMLQILLKTLNQLQISQNPQCQSLVKQLLSEPLQNIDKIHNLFRELIKCASLDQRSLQSFNTLMYNDFQIFWKCFKEYGVWNQRYQRSLRINRRVMQQYCNIARLPEHFRKNKQVLFGLIPQRFVHDDLINKLNVLQQIAGQFKSLLLRTSSDEYAIKISDIQAFIQKQNRQTLYINRTLLSKISMAYQSQTGLISPSFTTFLYELAKEQGKDEDQIKQSVILVNILLQRDQTEQTEQSQIMITDGDQKEVSRFNTNPKMVTQEDILSPSKIVSKIIKKGVGQSDQIGKQVQQNQMSLWIRKLIFVDQLKQQRPLPKQIYINKKFFCVYEQLPKQINLLENEAFEIKVITNQQDTFYEGVFIMNRMLDQIKVYSQGGKKLAIFQVSRNQPINQNDQSQIEVPIINQEKISDTKKYSRQSERDFSKDQSEKYSKQDQNILKDRMRAQTQFIKIKIVNISPSSHLSLKFSNNVIEFPNSEQLILKNEEVIKVKLLSQKHFNSKQENMLNFLGTTTLTFCNQSTNQIQVLVNIEVSEYLGQENLKYGKKIIICNIYHIESVKPFEGRQYRVHIQGPRKVKGNSIHANQVSRSLNINYTTKLQPYEGQYQILLLETIDDANQYLATFTFRINFESNIGIYKHLGYLINEQGYRLRLQVFEINYNDIFCTQVRGQEKFEKILDVFELQNFGRVSDILQNREIEIEPLLKQQMDLTLTQISVLMNLVQDRMKFLELFKSHEPVVDSSQLNLRNQSLIQLFKQFQLFDLEENGILSYQKAKIVNMLVFNGKLAIDPFKLEYVNKQQSKKSQKMKIKKLVDSFYEQNTVDYISILWSLRKHSKYDGFFFGIVQKSVSEIEKQNKNDRNIQKYRFKKEKRITLLGFKDLKLGRLPGTFVFKINQKQFCEPVPRSYSHSFAQPYPHLIVQYPCDLTIFNKQYGVTQLWKLVQIDSAAIKQEVEILGGKIYFKIEQPGVQQERYKPFKQKYAKKQENNQTLNQSTNNELRNTRQKWLSSKKNTSKDIKRIQDVLQQEVDLSKFSNILDQQD